MRCSLSSHRTSRSVFPGGENRAKTRAKDASQRREPKDTDSYSRDRMVVDGVRELRGLRGLAAGRQPQSLASRSRSRGRRKVDEAISEMALLSDHEKINFGFALRLSGNLQLLRCRLQ